MEKKVKIRDASVTFSIWDLGGTFFSSCFTFSALPRSAPVVFPQNNHPLSHFLPNFALFLFSSATLGPHEAIFMLSIIFPSFLLSSASFHILAHLLGYTPYSSIGHCFIWCPYIHPRHHKAIFSFSSFIFSFPPYFAMSGCLR